ncbi:hypothetical protein ABKN59_003045 [Abortiporus biennis]
MWRRFRKWTSRKFAKRRTREDGTSNLNTAISISAEITAQTHKFSTEGNHQLGSPSFQVGHFSDLDGSSINSSPEASSTCNTTTVGCTPDLTLNSSILPTPSQLTPSSIPFPTRYSSASYNMVKLYHRGESGTVRSSQEVLLQPTNHITPSGSLKGDNLTRLSLNRHSPVIQLPIAAQTPPASTSNLPTDTPSPLSPAPPNLISLPDPPRDEPNVDTNTASTVSLPDPYTIPIPARLNREILPSPDVECPVPLSPEAPSSYFASSEEVEAQTSKDADSIKVDSPDGHTSVDQNSSPNPHVPSLNAEKTSPTSAPDGTLSSSSSSPEPLARYLKSLPLSERHSDTYFSRLFQNNTPFISPDPNPDPANISPESVYSQPSPGESLPTIPDVGSTKACRSESGQLDANQTPPPASSIIRLPLDAFPHAPFILPQAQDNLEPPSFQLPPQSSPPGGPVIPYVKTYIINRNNNDNQTHRNIEPRQPPGLKYPTQQQQSSENPSPPQNEFYILKQRPQIVPQKTVEYLLKGQLGDGAHGVVVLGFNMRTGRRVAVKAIYKNQERAEEIFKSELHALKKIREMQYKDVSMLMPLYSAWQSNSSYFLVTLAARHDLLQHINLWGKVFSYSDRVLMAAEVLEAVSQLHDLHIHHGDIKLNNFLIASDGHIVLTDFGLAEDFSEQGHIKKKEDWDSYGTLGYMAPELYPMMDGFPVGSKPCLNLKALDVYAAGVTIEEILLGYSLALSAKTQNVYHEVTKLAPDAQSVVETMLSYNPADREDIHKFKSYPIFRTIFESGSVGRRAGNGFLVQSMEMSMELEPLSADDIQAFGLDISNSEADVAVLDLDYHLPPEGIPPWAEREHRI